MSDSIHDDAAPAGDEDSALKKGFQDPGVLQVYQTGPLTVVGFAGRDVPDEVCIAGYRDQMNKLIDEHGVKVMAIDLTGVKLVPSGMLGLMLTIRKKVDSVELYNPSEDVREVLRITNLEKMFDIKSVQI
jgi:ABC-type transporter Mla MlaB component